MSNQQTAVENLLNTHDAFRDYDQAAKRLAKMCEPMPQAVIDEVSTLLDLDEQAEAQRRILQWLEESDEVKTWQ